MSTRMENGWRPALLVAVMIVFMDAVIVAVIVSVSAFMWDEKLTTGRPAGSSDSWMQLAGVLVKRLVGNGGIAVSDILTIAMIPISLFIGIVVVYVVSDRDAATVGHGKSISIDSISDIERELGVLENDNRGSKLGTFTTFVRAVAFASTALLVLVMVFAVFPLVRRSINGDGDWSVSHGYAMLLCTVGSVAISFAVLCMTNDTGWMKRHRTWFDVNLAMRQLHLRSAHMGAAFERADRGRSGNATHTAGGERLAVTGIRRVLVKCRYPVSIMMALLSLWPILAAGVVKGLNGGWAGRVVFLVILAVIFLGYLFFVISTVSSRCLIHMNKCIRVTSWMDGATSGFEGLLCAFFLAGADGTIWFTGERGGDATGKWIALGLVSIALVTVWPFWLSSPRALVRLPRLMRPAADDADGQDFARGLRALLWLNALSGVSIKCWGKPFSTRLTRCLWRELAGAGRGVVPWPSSPSSVGPCPLCVERSDCRDEGSVAETDDDAWENHHGDRYDLCSCPQHGELASGRGTHLRRHP